MRPIIVPLSKSPHRQGRVGSGKSQDWFKSLVISVKLSNRYDAGILVLTAFQAAGSPSEADIYTRVLKSMGCTEVQSHEDLGAKKFLVVRECDETIGQVEYVDKVVKREWDMYPILISTFAHYLRVQWLAWLAIDDTTHFDHKIAFGIPRPKELITDCILTVVFPAMDILGLRGWFQKKVHGKREQGIHI